MDRVAACIRLLPALIKSVEVRDPAQTERIAHEIGELENQADITKNEIRNHLPKSIFLPIDRGALLEILSIQDNIADMAEDVAVLLTLKPLQILPEFQEDFHAFLHKNSEAFEVVYKIIHELHELCEFSFGGIEAEKVRGMVDQVAFLEHEADLIQRKLLRNLFQSEEKLTFSTFHLWQRVFEAIAGISNLSEKLANRIRMTLEIA